jgi:hypothetical protein
MENFWCVLRAALRATIWRATHQASTVGVPALLGWSLAAIGAGIAYEYALAGKAALFNPYGLNSAFAETAVVLAVASMFVPARLRATFLSTLCGVGLVITAVKLLFVSTVARWAFALPTDLPWLYRNQHIVLFAVALIWWIGAVYAILRSIIPTGAGHLLLRATALCLALVIAAAALPYYPAFRAPDFNQHRANLWEVVWAVWNGTFGVDKGLPSRYVDREQVDLVQPTLLEDQIRAFAPHAPGSANIYAVGMAGWSDQNVFVKELDGGLKSLSLVLPLGGHIIRLINNVDTAGHAPIASLQNFATTIHAIARVMDRDRDVLLLFMTSHGSRRGVALLLPGEFDADLSPRDVAMVLDSEAITNRIVIVSACYSGVFLKPLANDNSIVLTAADTNHPSFGCSGEREWTYFGDALFNRSLMPGEDLQHAFLKAKVTIRQWEARYGLAPSNPQGFFGRALTRKLALLYLHPGLPTPMHSAAGR